MRTLHLLCGTLAALATGIALGQVRVQAGPDAPVDAALAAEVVEAAAAALEQSHVYEDIGRKMAATLRTKSRSGDYAGATTGRALARAMGEDCQAVQADKQLKVFFRLPAGGGHGLPAFENGGYGKTEVLPGNGGGRPEGVALLSSYLFDGQVHLNSLYWRERDRTDESWTTESVRGPRYGARKPVFVLTSARTGSGAEEFSYNLQALKRATLVGETTAGAGREGALARAS